MQTAAGENVPRQLTKSKYPSCKIRASEETKERLRNLRKTCTNSSCRRTFTVKAETKVSCPFCGREYPRISPMPEPCYKWSVVLVHSGASKLNAVKVIRRFSGLGLREAKALADNVPSVLKRNVSRLEAQMLCSALQEVGACAELVRGKSITSPQKKKADWNVVLLGCTDRVSAIRAVEAVTGYSMYGAVNLVESAPSIVKLGLSYEEARIITRKLRESGAVAEMKKLTDREVQYYATV